MSTSWVKDMTSKAAVKALPNPFAKSEPCGFVNGSFFAL